MFWGTSRACYSFQGFQAVPWKKQWYTFPFQGSLRVFFWSEVAQIHLHMPSEHTLEGETYAAELQVVHRTGPLRPTGAWGGEVWLIKKPRGLGARKGGGNKTRTFFVWWGQGFPLVFFFWGGGGGREGKFRFGSIPWASATIPASIFFARKVGPSGQVGVMGPRNEQDDQM